MKEIWKDIIGYEGIYQISNLGRVKSLEREYWHGNRWYHQKEKYLSIKCDRNGYLSVMLYNADHVSKRIMVHLLVARHFIPNPDNLPEVNHKDENKKNPCVSNLEWCTCKYNANYGTKRKRISKSLKGRKQSPDSNKRRSITMKEHIKQRKAEGTYWF